MGAWFLSRCCGSLLLCALVLAGSGCATRPTVDAAASRPVAADPRDPWEGFNRRMFAVNEVIDDYAARPAARGYRKVVPEFLRTPVRRFFDNVRDLRSGVNNMLQWRWREAGQNLGRFAVNTTVGVGGLFDPASSTGLTRAPSDFGVTLAHWGMPSGPYLMLPGLGPSTIRETAAILPDGYLAVQQYIDHDRTYWPVWGLYLLDTREGVLDYERMIQGDKYVFLREFYLNRRATLNGQVGAEADFEFGGDLEADSDDDW